MGRRVVGPVVKDQMPEKEVLAKVREFLRKGGEVVRLPPAYVAVSWNCEDDEYVSFEEGTAEE